MRRREAGGGVASLERNDEELRNGIAATLGTGYDIRLGSGNFYLTPNVDLLVQFFSDATPASLIFTLDPYCRLPACSRRSASDIFR